MKLGPGPQGIRLCTSWLSCLTVSRVCCAHARRVKLGPGGMDALVTLGAGDMRRTLNILQARCPTTFLMHVILLACNCNVSQVRL